MREFTDYSRVRYPGPLGLVGQTERFPLHAPMSAPCACGGLITVDHEDRLAMRVRAHVLSDPHLSWSRATFPERHR